MKVIILRFPYTPAYFGDIICGYSERLEYDIEGVVTFDLNEKENSYKGHKIYPLSEIDKLSWDVALYACKEEDFGEIRSRLVELGIGKAEQFKNFYWLLQQFMMLKYEDCADPEIQATLEHWKTHDISIYNQYIQIETFDEVFYDSDCDLPYVNFQTVGGDWRKMYYPKIFDYHVRNGKYFVKDLLTEQLPTSPHLYITDKHKVNPGDVIIDAGVCEGNFALKYVDICSKMYLFEPEEKWHAPLKQTFKDYRDKLEIIPRFVSDVTDDKNTTLDDALYYTSKAWRGGVFLKMDIEGSEPKALRGAKKLLTENKVRASICAYHRADDSIRIKSILRKYGYEISTSKGYMTFLWCGDIFHAADFRKGIVYAEN